jgi:hypothetical protein
MASSDSSPSRVKKPSAGLESFVRKMPLYSENEGFGAFSEIT